MMRVVAYVSSVTVSFLSGAIGGFEGVHVEFIVLVLFVVVVTLAVAVALATVVVALATVVVSLVGRALVLRTLRRSFAAQLVRGVGHRRDRQHLDVSLNNVKETFLHIYWVFYSVRRQKI